MAVLLFGNVNTAIGGTGLTAYTDIPKFNTDSYAYLNAEYPASPAGSPFVYNPYKVIGMHWVTLDNAGTEIIVDATLTAEADGAVWPAATSSWFFILQNVGTNKITQSIHGSLLSDLTAVRDLVEASVDAGWVDPS